MPSKHSNVAPISHWRDAEAQIAMAEIHSQMYGECVIKTDDDPTYDTLTVSGKVGHFRYIAHYRQGEWPGLKDKVQRVKKSLDQREAIALLCERAQVAQNRALAADYVPTKAEPLTPELERLYARVVNDRPLPHGRSF